VLSGDMSDDELEDALKGVNKLLGGVAMILGTPAATGAAVAGNVVTQAAQALNNLLSDED
jgi:hypothetical protein